MENLTPPAMKPVLVNAVSDDVRTLRKPDVQQQQTVLTVRALADLFAGDEIKESNASDAKYFTSESGANKINFNLITDAGCRYIPETSLFISSSYPASAVNESVGGNMKTTPGFLYTMVVLPDGELSWSRYVSPRTIKNPSVTDVAQRGGVAANSIIRQLFYPTVPGAMNNTNGYTRTGWYDEVNQHYAFGDWELISGQMEHIIVTEDTEIQNPAVNSVYHLHANAIISLPALDTFDYRLGTKITFVQYPDAAEKTEMLASTVTYKDVTNGVDCEQRLTPQANRNTSEHVVGFLDSMVPASYTFEVTQTVDATGAETFKTWTLLLDNDETDYTAGFAAILASHNTQGEEDMIAYKDKQYGPQDLYSTTGANTYSDSAPLVIQRVAQTDGCLAVSLRKTADTLADEWKFKAFVLDWNNTDTFVVTSESSPSFAKLYFLKNTDAVTGEEEFVLASSTGHIQAFAPGKQYYVLNTPSDAKVVEVTGKDLVLNTVTKFYAEVKRGQSIYIAITPASSQDHSAAKSHVDALAAFVADPHPGSYLSRQMVNPLAFTAAQYGDIWRQIYKATATNAKDIPASTQALIEGIGYLGSKLQSKGLLTGSVGVDFVTNLSNMTNPGIYTVQTSVIDGQSDWPYVVKGGPVRAKLIVLGSDVSAATIMHPRDQYIATSDVTFTEGKAYFRLVDNEMVQMVAGEDYKNEGTVADVGYTVFQFGSQHIVSDDNVVQILMLPTITKGDGTSAPSVPVPASVWYRCSEVPPSDANFRFIPWICLSGLTKSYYPVTKDAVTADDMASWIKDGYTEFMFDHSGSVSVALPAGTNYPAGMRLKLMATAGTTVDVNGHSGVISAQYGITEVEVINAHGGWFVKPAVNMVEEL